MTDQEHFDHTPDAVTERPQPTLPDEDYYRQPPHSRRAGNAARLGVALVIVGLIWLALELFGYGPFFGTSQGVTLIQAPIPGNQVVLDIGAGDVDVRAGNDQDIRIETIQRGAWQGNPLVINRTDDRVQVTNGARPWFFGFCFGGCSLRYNITIPRGVATSVRTSSGDISTTGLDAAVSLTSSSGDVNLHSIAGKLDVTTSSGDVQLDDGRVADVTVQTSSGDIELHGVTNALALTSSSGDITVRDARGARLDIQTSSGDVDYTGDLSRAGDSSVTTASGDVTLRLTSDTGFVLNASTTSGELRSNFDLQNGQRGGRSLSGTVGAGGATLKIATGSGDISVERQ